VEAFGRDIVGELITAARAGGIQPGLYFSHADWADPNLRLDFINPLVQGACISPLSNKSTRQTLDRSHKAETKGWLCRPRQTGLSRGTV
jgi:hypothetical protein